MRARLIGAFVLVGLAALPGPAAAGLGPPEASGVSFEVRRLAEVRERLERRRALQRSLQGRVERLAQEIDDVRVRLERTSYILESERQEALILERRLDQLVPRFLARMAEARRHRGDAARVLADLAGKSRSPYLDPRMRARMLALKPLLLQRLRPTEAHLGLFRARRDEAIERYAQIARRLPALAKARQHLEQLSLETLRLREAALDELRGLQTEVALLASEKAELARRFLRGEAASVVHAEPQADQRALPDSSAMRRTSAPSALRFPSASVDKGGVRATPRVTRVADAWDDVESRLVAGASESHAGVGSSALAAAAGAPTRRSDRAKLTQTALRGDATSAQSRGARAVIGPATAVDVAFRREGDLAGRRSATALGRRTAAPILPLPAAAQDRVAVGHGGPELTFNAAPGQRVAAPVDGKVVFAGTFKSYGWLLILEHEREYHTLLWGFARLDVKRGDQVQVGQIVGIMGAQGDGPPVLHVEWRRNGRPIDLAASSNGIQG